MLRFTVDPPAVTSPLSTTVVRGLTCIFLSALPVSVEPPATVSDTLPVPVVPTRSMDPNELMLAIG
jgi:hypothetical protein